MFVREYMTHNPVTITADVSVPQALRLMRDKEVRRLPVLDGQGKLTQVMLDDQQANAETDASMWKFDDPRPSAKRNRTKRR